MSTNKKVISQNPPPCPTCGATMDLKCWESFGSRHTASDGKLYYCNNPACPPDEEERNERFANTAANVIEFRMTTKQ